MRLSQSFYVVEDLGKSNNKLESNWKSVISSSKNGCNDFPVEASRTPKVKATIVPFFPTTLLEMEFLAGQMSFIPQ